MVFVTNKSFHYKDLLIEIHSEVYDPAEDTYLLLDAIDVKENDAVLEIGTGCGIIALECAKIGANVISTDINPIAVELVKKNYLVNQNKLNGNFEVRNGDLFSPILFSETFDVIIFNPPYLPTKKDERVGGWYDAALDGGESGIETTKKFIENLTIFLKKNGRAYFVFSSLSDKNELESFIKQKKLDFKIVESKTYDGETLSIYRIKNR